MTDLETQQFFDEMAPTWDQNLNTADDDERIRELLSRVNIPRGATVLDVGCGTGRLFHILPPLIGTTGKVIALDFADNMVQQARTKRLPNIYLLCGDAHSLPFAQERFDIVIGFAVFPHIRDQTQALVEFCRVLKVGGRVVIMHLRGSKELNAIHRQVGKAVKNHQLSNIEEMGTYFRTTGFELEIGIDEPEGYLVVGIKGLPVHGSALSSNKPSK